MQEEKMSSYSEIISAEDYNNLMTTQHLYIHISDAYIARVIDDRAKKGAKEVVELGCGPARITGLVRKTEEINLTGVDIDKEFIEYARNKLKDKKVEIVNSDICTYKHGKPVDIFYSQGFHHHMPKGEVTNSYLRNVYSQLKPGGIYIIGDEFVPEYVSSEDREKKLVVWYSHIIANALSHNYTYLAEEEAKTLLDDLYEGRVDVIIKNKKQIDFVLSRVSAIDNAARASDIKNVDNLVKEFLSGLEYFYEGSDTAKEIVLSRGDYKICDSVFRKEIEEVGFKVLNSKSFGPMTNIGAMVIYVLEK